MHIIKITASIPTKFCTVIKTTKCPSWMVPIHGLQKSKNRYISAAVRGILTKFGLESQFDLRAYSDRWNFKNPRWRRPPSWKIVKSPYLGHTLTDCDEIWHAGAVRPSWPFRPLKIEISKILDGGGRHFEKSKNSHISAAFQSILTKFGLEMQFDPLGRSDR